MARGMQPEGENVQQEIEARMKALAALYSATGWKVAALAWGSLELARLREEDKGEEEIDVPF